MKSVCIEYWNMIQADLRPGNLIWLAATEKGKERKNNKRDATDLSGHK